MGPGTCSDVAIMGKEEASAQEQDASDIFPPAADLSQDNNLS